MTEERAAGVGSGAEPWIVADLRKVAAAACAGSVPALRRSAGTRGVRMLTRTVLAALFTVALVDLTADVVALI